MPVALSRVDALAVVALAAEGQVVGAFTPDAHVPLPDGARAPVEIPRFAGTSEARAGCVEAR